MWSNAVKRFEEAIEGLKTAGGALLKRPLFPAGICFALGVSLAVAATPPLWAWLPGLAAGAFFGFRHRRGGKHVFAAALCLMALCAGGLRAGLDYPARYAWVPQGRAEAELSGRVAAAPVFDGDGAVLVLDFAVVRTDGREIPLDGRVRLRLAGRADRAAYGRSVAVRAVVSVPDGARYPGDFDYRMYLLGQGVRYTAYAEAGAARFTGEAAWYDPMAWGAFVRSAAETAIADMYPEQARGVMTGILLGGHAGIADRDYRAFRDAGIAHVLAVSGLHVGFVVAALVALMRLLRVKKRAQWWITAGILAFYSLVVGFVPSVLRASVMALVLLYARSGGQRPDSLSALSFALVLVLIINPLDWFGAGLRLSFCAALGIILLYPSLVRALKRLPRFLREGVSVCIAAQLGMLTVMVNAFNGFSVIAVFANLLFVPLFGVLMAAGALSLLLNAVSAAVAGPVAFVGAKLVEGMMLGVRELSGLGFAAYRMVSWPAWLCLMWMAALWLGSRAGGLTPKRRVKAVAALAAAALLLLAAGLFWPQPLRIVMLDVGQAECIVIKTPDRRTYLVDCGAPVTADPARSEITEYLLKNGVVSLEGVMVTHGHSDHTAGLDAVAQVFLPRWVAFPGGMRKALDLHGAQRVRLPEPGAVLDLGGGAAVETVSAGAKEDASAMFVLRYGGFSMLFTGDAYSDQEIEALPLIGRIDVLKVGHHGSAWSTSRQLLERARPLAALISVGANAYGLPAQAALNRLKAAGADVYRTDEDGCIEVVTDGDRFTVRGLAGPLVERRGNE